MYPRIKLITMLIIASGLLLCTQGCLTLQLTVNGGVRSETPPNHDSPLFRTWATNSNGGEIGGNFIPIHGIENTLGVGYDMPRGQTYGNYIVTSTSYKIGAGKWIKIKSNHHSKSGLGYFNIGNRRDGSESKLFIRTTFAYDVTTYDDHGEPELKRVQVPKPAIKIYVIKFYRT